jgi:hypothetical protein
MSLRVPLAEVTARGEGIEAEHRAPGTRGSVGKSEDDSTLTSARDRLSHRKHVPTSAHPSWVGPLGATKTYQRMTIKASSHSPRRPRCLHLPSRARVRLPPAGVESLG